MSKHSNRLQKWILKSEQDRIEALIAHIEKRYPFEVVVAFTDAPPVVPIAAARMIALFAIAAELFAEVFWLPIPAWIFGLCVFFFLLAPVGNWARMAIFRVLARKSEKKAAVQNQAESCFSDLGLARTRDRNALLLFFNLKERIFCLRPDRTLEKEWPELKIEELVTELKVHLDTSKNPASAAAQAIERLHGLAHAHWPSAVERLTSANEISNALTWWESK